MNVDEDLAVEVAEEADLSLNASLADSQSNFGDIRYRDFEESQSQVSIQSANSSNFSRFEDSEEPRLKYDRLSSDIKKIIERGDSAEAVTVHDKFIVVGTHWGKIYILDALGHIMPQLEEKFTRHSHSVAVSQISVDHPGEHIASCSTDGRVMITGLYTNENNHSLNAGKPIYSVALDPIFARTGSGKRFITGDDDNVILYERGGLLNRYKPRPLSDGTDGPIKNIKWRGRFAAWTSKRGVVVHDVVQEKNISIIRLAQIEPAFDVCRLSWSDQKSLYVTHGDMLRICRIRRREHQDLPQNQRLMRDMPHFMVEIVHTIKMDSYWLCGAAPMKKLMVLLALPKVIEGRLVNIGEEETELEEEENDDNKPQLIVIEPLDNDDFHEISTDYLCLKDYDKQGADLMNTLSLEYLLEDQHYFIVSPRDMFFGKPRDEDDHLDWLLLQENFEKALKYAETHHRRLRRHSIYLIGRKYLDHLIENGKFEEIGPLYQRIFKNEKRLWEEEITRLILLHKVDAISTFVPMGHEKNQLKLEPHIYEAILISLLKMEPRKDQILLQLVRDWPPKLYDISKIVIVLLDHLVHLPDNQTLKRALATLYSHEKKYDKAMAMYLNLGHKDVFQLIRKHDLFFSIEDKIVQLMELDSKDAIKLFLEHSDKLGPELIVEKLKVSTRQLYLYLDTLCQKDWDTSKKFHIYLVELYADYNPEKLLQFLKSSDHYPIQEALDTCTKHVRELVDERIYILARMSNTREALRLITSENYDIHKAVEFCKEYDDVDLWHDLIDFSIDKPYFVHVLLHNIGTHVDPRILIERIENGREIPGLRDSLVQIMHDYQLQVTLQEGCNKILVADCFTLLQRQFHNASRGLEVHEASLCGGCGGQCISHSTDLSDSFVFNCKHAFHSECFASKLDDTTEDYKSTTCPLCHAK